LIYFIFLLLCDPKYQFIITQIISEDYNSGNFPFNKVSVELKETTQTYEATKQLYIFDLLEDAPAPQYQIGFIHSDHSVLTGFFPFHISHAASYHIVVFFVTNFALF
jgi:hypothetical protein